MKKIEELKEKYLKKFDELDKDGLEIDLYSDEHKFGIEINGVYYHSEITGKKSIDYHLNKTIKANKNGINLIHIFEDEIKQKYDLVINKIKYILNVSGSTRIGARNCVISNSNQNIDEFLIENYIDGVCEYDRTISAYYNDDLVAVMCFTDQMEGIYELVRFAVKSGYVINGMGYRLLKRFIIDNTPNKIISFGDRRWTKIGENLYTKLGFMLVDIIEHDFTYIKLGVHDIVRYDKSLFNKNELMNKFPHVYDENKTEWEMMQEFGYDRIWDCGKLKYVMYVDNKNTLRN